MLAATVVIGVKTGLIVGTSWLGKWHRVAVAAVFGVCLYLLVLIFGPHQQILVALLDRYTFIGSLLMAILLIYLGLQQGPEQDGSPVRQYSLKQKSSRYKYYIGFLPCPLCLAALAFSVIIISQVLDLSPGKLGLPVAALFAVLVLAVAAVMGRLVYTVKFNPATVFNNVLLFFGTVTLIFALLIPNFVRSMAMPLAPLTIGSPYLVGLVLVGMAVFGVLGYMADSIYYAKDCDKV